MPHPTRRAVTTTQRVGEGILARVRYFVRELIRHRKTPPPNPLPSEGRGNPFPPPCRPRPRAARIRVFHRLWPDRNSPTRSASRAFSDKLPCRHPSNGTPG